jgi:glutathione synthase
MPSPPYPPPLPPARLAHLLAETTGWSLGHGLAVRPSAAELGGADGDGEGRGEALAVVAPIALFPSLFPRRAFEEARRVQTAFNRLYVAVARDEGWLGAVVGG